MSQRSTVDSLTGTAVGDGDGAWTLRPATTGFWGNGGVARAPDGAIWKVATSSKMDTGPATRQIDDIVLLLGVEGVKATKRFYVDRGLTVAKSFGGKYVEFGTTNIKVALYSRRALAKDAGVSPEGTGSNRIAITSDTGSLTGVAEPRSDRRLAR